MRTNLITDGPGNVPVLLRLSHPPIKRCWLLTEWQLAMSPGIFTAPAWPQGHDDCGMHRSVPVSVALLPFTRWMPFAGATSVLHLPALRPTLFWEKMMWSGFRF